MDGDLMGFYSDLMGYESDIPSGYVKITIDNVHRKSEFCQQKWGFSIAMFVITRGYMWFIQGLGDGYGDSWVDAWLIFG